jgi:hypothetical protein
MGDTLVKNINRLGVEGWLFLTFIVLTIFEGALRKWLGLPLPLFMAIRDLLAIVCIARVIFSRRYEEMPIFFKLLLYWTVLVVITSLLQVIINQTPLIIVFIGWRFWLLYLWFALAVASSLSAAEVRLIVKVLMLITICLVPLSVIQYSLPSSHIINTLPETDISQIFILSGEKVRVTGPFTFTLGFTCFVAMILPFSLSGHLQGRPIIEGKYWALIMLSSALILSFVSGSRAGLIWAGILYVLFVFLELIVNRSKEATRRLFFMIFFGAFFTVIILIWFSDSVAAYTERFQSASEVENFADRILIIFLGEPHVLSSFSIIGSGFGLGSNAARIFIDTGVTDFLLAESEPGRNLLEGGVLGGVWLLSKIVFGLYWTLWSVMFLRRTGDILPFLISITCFYAFSTWTVTGQLSAHALAYILLTFFIFLVHQSNFKIKLSVS